MSCNSKSEETEEIVVTSSNVAIKDFYLKANSKILDHLDSVFFSIDLENGVIFNADSLPKGTNVSRLLPTITFANSMTKADLTYKRENQTDTTVNYLTNPNDSIDFTHPVKLDVTAADGVSSFTYTLKVNVHLQEPDSLIWDKLAMALLPSRMENPINQKSLIHNGKAFSFIEENDGTFTMSVSDDLYNGEWEKSTIEFPFEPELSSITSTGTQLWVLSTDGELFSSQDAAIWETTGLYWISILGGYNEGVLGIRQSEEGLVHTSFPEYLQGKETVLEDGFPVRDFSAMGTVENPWTPYLTAFIYGGTTIDGSYSSLVWAFDGTVWDSINSTPLPSLQNPMLARYVVYREKPNIFQYREFDAWFILGGIDEDGEFNRTLYVSLDNGVVWSEASEMMQLPDDFPSLSGADILVMGYELSADLSDAWAPVETKSTGFRGKPSYSLDGYEISWICPYMYVFGGIRPDGYLSDTIWRGVLARLTFTPVI